MRYLVVVAMVAVGCSTSAQPNCSANINGVDYTPGAKSPTWCFAYETSEHMLDVEVHTGIGDDGLQLAVQDNIPSATFLSLAADSNVAADGSNSAQMRLNIADEHCSAFSGNIAVSGKDNHWLLSLSSTCTLNPAIVADGTISIVIQ